MQIKDLLNAADGTLENRWISRHMHIVSVRMSLTTSNRSYD